MSRKLRNSQSLTGGKSGKFWGNRQQKGKADILENTTNKSLLNLATIRSKQLMF